MGLRPTRANEDQRRHPRASGGAMVNCRLRTRNDAVTPAQAGAHVRKNWIPAYAGMTCVR